MPRTSVIPANFTTPMRLIVARCSAIYSGRLDTVLPEALRLIMVKDGRVDPDPCGQRWLQAAELDDAGRR